MNAPVINRREAALKTLGRLPKPLGHFIGGKTVAGTGPLLAVLEPATGQELGRLRDASEAELNDAVAAAKAAFPAWSSTSGEARRKLLHRIADLIEARAEEIAALECLDTGQCWRFMSKAALRG